MGRGWIVLLLVLVATGRAAAQSPTCNLNGSGADELIITVGQSGTDFDLGWKGKYHDSDVPGGAQFELCLTNCDTSTDPLCDVAGYAGGQSAAGRGFAPTIPAVFGTTAVCIRTTFQEPFATGTANLSTGDLDVTANIAANVYLTTTSAVCPKCSGAAPGDSGTCSGEQAIRFLGSVYATARFFLVTADVFSFFFLGSSISRWTFEGLHCEHRPASIVVCYIEQHTMSTRVNGATGALSMGPSAGYISIFELVKFNLIFVMIGMLFMNILTANLSSSKITHVHMFVITFLLLILD